MNPKIHLKHAFQGDRRKKKKKKDASSVATGLLQSENGNSTDGKSPVHDPWRIVMTDRYYYATFTRITLGRRFARTKTKALFCDRLVWLDPDNNSNNIFILVCISNCIVIK